MGRALCASDVQIVEDWAVVNNYGELGLALGIHLKGKEYSLCLMSSQPVFVIDETILHHEFKETLMRGFDNYLDDTDGEPHLMLRPEIIHDFMDEYLDKLVFNSTNVFFGDMPMNGDVHFVRYDDGEPFVVLNNVRKVLYDCHNGIIDCEDIEEIEQGDNDTMEEEKENPVQVDKVDVADEVVDSAVAHDRCDEESEDLVQQTTKGCHMETCCREEKKALKAISISNYDDCENCEDCVDCVGCVNCKGCVGCVNCNGCEDCCECVNCTDCIDSYKLKNCNGCETCNSCMHSESLALCMNCKACSDIRGAQNKVNKHG